MQVVKKRSLWGDSIQNLETVQAVEKILLSANGEALRGERHGLCATKHGR
jgi:hypothetical protein